MGSGEATGGPSPILNSQISPDSYRGRKPRGEHQLETQDEPGCLSMLTHVPLQPAPFLTIPVKRISFVSLSLVLAILASYYLWKINHAPVVGAWDLVTEEALAVYERNPNSTNTDAESLLKSFLTDSLRKGVRNAKELLISVHVIGKEEVGIVLYLQGSPSTERDIAPLPHNRSCAKRNFEGYHIPEVQFRDRKTISIVTIDPVLMISSSSLLIEDAIRLSKSDEKQNFIQSNKTLFQFARMESEGGHVYVNLSHLQQFHDFFLLKKNQNPMLDHFARSGVVDIKKRDRTVVFSGFAVDSVKGPSILSLFNQQGAVPISLEQIIDKRAGSLIHFGISDFDAWTAGRLEFCKALRTPVTDSLKAIQERYGFEANRFYGALGDELGVCLAGIFSDELFIVELKNAHEAITQLNKLRRHNKGDLLPMENYSHYQIRSLNVPGLPVALFWPLADHAMNYYVVTDHHLIFSQDLDDLKSFIDDLNAENTWGKSIEWNEFLSTSQETNVGIIFDGLNGWPSLRTILTSKWLSFGDSTHLLNISKASFQFTRLERSYYFNGVLEFNPKRSRSALERKEQVLEVSLPQPIATPLTVVRNHTNGSSELFAQDHANTVFLFSSKLKNLFKTKVDGPITTEINQIDFYKNEKLQYFFATEKSIYLIDRLGKMVQGFPRTWTGKNPIRFLTVLGYDNTKNYRFLISDTQGRMTLQDRQGQLVPEWRGVELSNELWVDPRPVRSRGKDYLFVITKEGVVYGFNKKGEPLKGFPVTLKIRPNGNFVFEKKDGREAITLVSEDGVWIQLDVTGKIVNKNNLLKSSAASRFSLASTPDDHYVISRIDKNKMAVLDGTGNVLFEKDNPGSNELYLTYFEVGRGQKLFGFTDPQQEFTYFFNENGHSVFPHPLENQKKPAIAIDKSGNTYFYGVNRNQIQSYKPARINY